MKIIEFPFLAHAIAQMHVQKSCKQMFRMHISHQSSVRKTGLEMGWAQAGPHLTKFCLN